MFVRQKRCYNVEWITYIFLAMRDRQTHAPKPSQVPFVTVAYASMYKTVHSRVFKPTPLPTPVTTGLTVLAVVVVEPVVELKRRGSI
jgi:hypothetical protein